MSNLEEDIITHEEVEMWSLEALREYCRHRGYKVTGSKKDLVSRVYFLYNEKVPVEPGIKEQEISKKYNYKEIYLMKFKMKVWISEQEGIKHWPPVTYIDIDIFLKDKEVQV